LVAFKATDLTEIGDDTDLREHFGYTSDDTFDEDEGADLKKEGEREKGRGNR
jgi:hypothetical protein